MTDPAPSITGAVSEAEGLGRSVTADVPCKPPSQRFSRGSGGPYLGRNDREAKLVDPALERATECRPVLTLGSTVDGDHDVMGAVTRRFVDECRNLSSLCSSSFR